MMVPKIDQRTADTRAVYDAAYTAAYAAYRDAALVRGRAVAHAVAHGDDPAFAAAAEAISAACVAARAVETAAFAALAEAVENNLVALYESKVAQILERSRT